MTTSYPKLYHVGSKENLNVFDGPVEIQEKIDGSQFNFGVKDGVFWARSKHNNLSLDAGGLFGPSILWASSLAQYLKEGWSYRGEAVSRNRHNILTYGRTPKGNTVLWDVQDEYGRYLPAAYLLAEAERIGAESSPLLYYGCTSLPDVHRFLGHESFLGATTIEGIVIKNRGNGQSAKLVFDQFRELAGRHKLAPSKAPVTDQIAAMLRTEARWNKAVQHLREKGELTGSVQDIGPLIREIYADINAEARREIEVALMEAFLKDILKKSVIGVAEWYKAKLAADAPL